MPTCPHPYELQSLIDGAASDEELRRLREHAAGCDACAKHLAELERLRWLLRAKRLEPPAGLLEHILQFVATAIPVRKLACKEARELASAYIDDELNELERETLEAHLFACDDCFYEYVAMRTAAQAMREAPPVVASEGLKARILAAVAADEVSAAPTPAPPMVRVRFAPASGWRRVLVPTMAIAAMAVLCFGVVQVMNQPSAPGVPGPQPAATVASAPSVQPEASATVPSDRLDTEAPATPAPGTPVAAPSVNTPPATTLAKPEEARLAAGPAATVGLPRATTNRGVAAPSRGTKPVSRMVASAATSAVRGGSTSAPRRVAVLAPPVTREAPRLASAGRTASTPRAGYRPNVLRTLAPSASMASTGVTGVRSLGSGGPSAPLTRPEPRIARNDGLEETPADRLESRRLVRTVSGSHRVYEGSGDVREKLAAVSSRINEEANSGRRLSGGSGMALGKD
ncbi:zf-HC2 domain-containing protein [bacterium]|nr:zf-HC2 domain-containing protein [bacterium]